MRKEIEEIEECVFAKFANRNMCYNLHYVPYILDASTAELKVVPIFSCTPEDFVLITYLPVFPVTQTKPVLLLHSDGRGSIRAGIFYHT
jgi:hypothetical protein